MQKYVQNLKGKRHIIKTARVYLRYCSLFERLDSNLIEKYRKVLKLEKSKVDVYVPSNEEVLSNYNKIKDNSSYELIYLVLMTSGIRYIEALKFLKSYDVAKFRIYSNFVSYNVSDLRHTKNINNIYLPLFVYEKLKNINNTYNSIRQRFKERDVSFSLKYLRKWHYNFLLYNNVPESVADFVQGRASKSISANHYLAKAQQVEHWYPKVADNLKDLIYNKKFGKNQYKYSEDTINTTKKKVRDYSKEERKC